MTTLPTLKFTCYAPGLYVDSTNTYAISRDAQATCKFPPLYTVRRITGFGVTLSGKMWPEYSDIFETTEHSLSDAKDVVFNWLIADGKIA